MNQHCDCVPPQTRIVNQKLMNNLKHQRSSAILAAICLSGSLSAGLIYNPDVSSGSYTTIPEFEFNQAPGPIPAGFYSGTGGLFIAPAPSGSASAAVVPGGAIGNGGQVAIVSPFNGPGTGIFWNNVMNVSAGQSYVISGFAKVSPGTTSNVYIDLWDVSGDIYVQFDKSFSDGWQFAYETFTAPFDMVIGARAILDFTAGAGDSVIFDNLAVTPFANFVAPSVTPVPEPETYAMAAGTALLALGVWRRCRR